MSGLRLCISYIRCGRQKFWLQALWFVPGNQGPRWEKTCLGSSSFLWLHFPLFSTATTSSCLPPRPCLAPHTACHIHRPSPALSFCLSSWENSWVFTPPSPPTHLALVPSAFESRNFSPPHCLTPMIITKSARDRLLALLPQVLGLAMGCESLQLKLQGSPAWTVVGTCSGRMKASGV